MADWYTQHLYKICEAKFHEKFHRKSPLPQWIGWNNKYNQSLNYEVYDSSLGVYIKRMVPKKIPKVMEFSFVDSEEFLPKGFCIYRQEETLYWFSIMFGTDITNRDDSFITQPAAYSGIEGLYYSYIHDTRVKWNDTRIIYIFTVLGPTKVYAIDALNPDKIYAVDTSTITGCLYNLPQVPWICDAAGNVSLDIRLSDTAIEGSTTNYIGTDIGIHKCFYTPNELIEEDPIYAITRVSSLDVLYSEDNDDLMFLSNLPLTVWWRNRPSPGVFPPLDGEDENDYKLSTLPYQYVGFWSSGISYSVNQIVFYGSYNYKCTSDHISSSENSPVVDSSPWVQFEWFTYPLGTTGYSYSVGSIPTSNLEYEWVNWRSDADREWYANFNRIVVRTGGGFAYILLA